MSAFPGKFSRVCMVRVPGMLVRHAGPYPPHRPPCVARPPVAAVSGSSRPTAPSCSMARSPPSGRDAWNSRGVSARRRGPGQLTAGAARFGDREVSHRSPAGTATKGPSPTRRYTRVLASPARTPATQSTFVASAHSDVSAAATGASSGVQRPPLHSTSVSLTARPPPAAVHAKVAWEFGGWGETLHARPGEAGCPQGMSEGGPREATHDA